MLVDPAELARFEACAARADARFVERCLMDDVERAVARFERRGETDPDDPWHAHVRTIVAANGGDQALRRCHSALQRLLEQRPDAVLVPCIDGAVDATYERLISTIA